LSEISLNEVTTNVWSVRKDAKDRKGIGYIQLHKYFTYTKTGKRKKASFWTARMYAGGPRSNTKTRCASKEEALAVLLKEAKIPYNERKMSWKGRQGESADLKERRGEREKREEREARTA